MLVPAEASVVPVGAPGHQVAAGCGGASPHVVKIVLHVVGVSVVRAPKLVVDPLLLCVCRCLFSGVKPKQRRLGEGGPPGISRDNDSIKNVKITICAPGKLKYWVNKKPLRHIFVRH